MTPTGEQLCYSDAYLRSVEARVASVEAGEATLLVLDRTVFYPGGGGQPSDRGLVLRGRRTAGRGRFVPRASPVARSSTSSNPTATRRRPWETSFESTSIGHDGSP